jgi:hypothetical protein
MDPSKLISPGNGLAHSRVFRERFPHMGPADAVVWRVAKERFFKPGTKFDYDHRLGGIGAQLIDATHPHFGMWASLLKKRVDVVAWIGKQPWLIEVKPIGSFAALGQALGYCDLWERENGTKPKPVPCVACALCDPDLIPTFERYGVKVFSLPLAEAEALLGR